MMGGLIEDRDSECGRREKAARQVWAWDCGIGLRVLVAVFPLHSLRQAESFSGFIKLSDNQVMMSPRWPPGFVSRGLDGLRS
jgi:hypothetical protein